MITCTQTTEKTEEQINNIFAHWLVGIRVPSTDHFDLFVINI